MTLDRRLLDFFVPGVPIPQGSKRIVAPKGQAPRLIDVQSAALKKWRSAVAQAARYYRGVMPTITGDENAIEITAWFTMARPASVRGRVYPTVAPDLDKLYRAVGDALKDGGVYRDDSMVVDLVARKRYVGHPEASESPGVRVVVRLVERRA